MHLCVRRHALSLAAETRLAFLDARWNRLPHVEPRNPRDSANEPAQICSQAVSNIFYSGAAQWQHRCLCWQVGFDVCQGASPSMREGTWSANELARVSVERTRKNNLRECRVSVGLPRRSKVSL